MSKRRMSCNNFIYFRKVMTLNYHQLAWFGEYHMTETYGQQVQIFRFEVFRFFFFKKKKNHFSFFQLSLYEQYQLQKGKHAIGIYIYIYIFLTIMYTCQKFKNSKKHSQLLHRVQSRVVDIIIVEVAVAVMVVVLLLRIALAYVSIFCFGFSFDLILLLQRKNCK